ncbi:hypothetical protein PPYR_08268 [Photinus pyralis]|uniref:DDE-1 domain-containing protein n=1 Tax=Photinus pyralis TaxID=7054 RepID=A0A5N4AIZ1_PHOPY|nr:hypothetical protein PPYR_08268 [Photinus pyralis]
MFAVSGDGHLLPPFVVYKSEHLYDTWLTNGPPGARYGRNKSGWFDQPLFEEWFISIPLPFLKRRPAPRVVIGDNLCSHLSHRVIELCEENNIRFSFLPPNSTHLTQPLDVSVFGPMKKAWRSTLEERNLEEDDPNGWTESVVEVLNESRNSCKPTVARKKKVTVEPGKSISTTDFLEAQPSTSKATVPEDSQEDDILEHESDKAESEAVELDECFDVQHPMEDECFDVQHPMESSFATDDFVEVEFKTNKVGKYFIGQIKGLFDKSFEVKFLRPNRKIENCFIFPTVEDICMITPE